jgi:hypothetical protein
MLAQFQTMVLTNICFIFFSFDLKKYFPQLTIKLFCAIQIVIILIKRIDKQVH